MGDGDSVEVEIERVGLLRNRVIGKGEDAAASSCVDADARRR